MSPPGVLRVVTYNVHGCVGTDFTRDCDRVARVLEACEADVIALQELDAGRARSGGVDQPGSIAERLGMHRSFTHALERDGGHYGNAVLSRHPIDEVRSMHLPRVAERTERRALQWVRVRLPGDQALNVLNTHLGLDARERLAHADAIIGRDWAAVACAQGPTVLCGDFNAGPRSAVYRALTGLLTDAQVAPLQRVRPRGTFPSWLPVLRIDHILVSADMEVVRSRVVDGMTARLASDHLPLLVELRKSEATWKR